MPTCLFTGDDLSPETREELRCPSTWLNPCERPLDGTAEVLFAQHPGLAPEWRLLVMTGFLGGLTTFSAFSAEVTALLQHGRLLWAGAAISAHVLGSLALTLAGMATVSWLTRS